MRDSKRDTVKNRLLDSVGEGKGAVSWENSTETCILPYVKQITIPGLMHETGCSGPGHWDDPEGWDGERGKRGVQDVEHINTHGWFMSMYGKNLQYFKVISSQLKKKKRNPLTQEPESVLIPHVWIPSNIIYLIFPCETEINNFKYLYNVIILELFSSFL